MAFGGRAWPINSDDMNLGRVSSTSNICAGGIFDLTAGSNIGEGGGNPNWVVGATFLKNVYSVFRSDPAAIGFAELSDAAGGSSGKCFNLAVPFIGKCAARSRRFQLIKALHPVPLLLGPLLLVVLQVLHQVGVELATVPLALTVSKPFYPTPA